MMRFQAKIEICRSPQGLFGKAKRISLGGGLIIAARASRGWSQSRMRGHSPRWEVLSVFEEQRRQEVSWAGSLARVMMPL
jgi:hypothetical protein